MPSIRRLLLLIVPGLLVLALAGGFLWLGAFPPKARVQSVVHSVPIDRLAPPPQAPATLPALPALPPVQAPAQAPVQAPTPPAVSPAH